MRSHWPVRDMASLPPLRARAVTSIFSDCDGIDDAVRRVRSSLKKVVAFAKGARQLHEFAKGKGMAFSWDAVRLKQPEV